MLRNLLEEVFGLPSYSVYKERRHPTYPHLDPAVEPTSDFNDFYPQARCSELGFLVKTHGPPLDDAPAIKIVRDGRASIVSYYHYLRDFNNIHVSMTDVVEGKTPFGSWSESLDNWDPLNRRSTLLLHYEDMIEFTQHAIELLARFLGLFPTGQPKREFSDLQRSHPRFFRAGNNDHNIAELTREDLDLFWGHHRDWMLKLGYDDTNYTFRSALTSVPVDLPSVWYQYPKG